MISINHISDEVTLLQRELAEIHKNPELYNLESKIVRKGNRNDYTTAVDRAVEKMLKPKLQEIVPGSGFLGEETDASEGDRRYVWVVDPTDGTAVFSMGGEYYSSSVALVDKKEQKIVFGSVYQSATGRQFVRTHPYELLVREEAETYPTGLAETIARRPNPSRSKCFAEWLGCSFGSSDYYPENPGMKERLEGVFKLQSTDVPNRKYAPKDAKPASGSSALFCCDIADGNRHFAVLFFQKAWDLAVGTMYARDAGCPVMVFNSNGSPTGEDIERLIVNCRKETLVNVGVFGNAYIKEKILERFNEGYV